jgi:hypothetical protein
MKAFFSSIESIFDERTEHFVLLIGAVKEGADVTMMAECAPGEMNGVVDGVHVTSSHTQRRCIILASVHARDPFKSHRTLVFPKALRRKRLSAFRFEIAVSHRLAY